MRRAARDDIEPLIYPIDDGLYVCREQIVDRLIFMCLYTICCYV